jgi:uncharacterized membrane protein
MKIFARICLALIAILILSILIYAAFVKNDNFSIFILGLIGTFGVWILIFILYELAEIGD